MAETSPAATLTEHVGDWRDGLTIERDQRILKGIALVGPSSRNGYVYSEAALQGAVSLYEGRPVFLDHPADRTQPNNRSTKDLAGTIRNARFEAGRIRGDVHALDTDSGRTLLAIAESNPPGVGMSHVAAATRSKDGKTVESIQQVVSVDVVIGPATTSTFRESTETETAQLRQEVQALRQLIESRLAPTSTPRAPAAPTQLTEADFVRAIKAR